MRRAIAACVLLLLAGRPPGAMAQQAPAPVKTRTFAVIPFYAVEKLYSLYTPFIQHLNQAGIGAWELKLYHSHESLIEGFCKGEVDVVQLGPVPMARVNRKCGAVPFLLALSPEGLPTYRSVLITADPAVRALDDLKGRPFGFYKGSTAAHILPSRMLKEAGVLSEVQAAFFASQDAILNALTSREISGAGVKESLYRRVAGEHFRVLATSEPVPNFSFAVLPGTDPAISASFAEALLKLHPKDSPADAQTARAWDDEIKNGFLRPPADFLQSVARLSSLTEEILGASR
jgi:ABC-type phosphate/phosphonate transport system substrate-binding protein